MSAVVYGSYPLMDGSGIIAIRAAPGISIGIESSSSRKCVISAMNAMGSSCGMDMIEIFPKIYIKIIEDRYPYWSIPAVVV